MKSKVGKLDYITIWNQLPKRRIREIHDYIKYNKLEPLSAVKLTNDLIDFGDEIALSPFGYPSISKLSVKKYKYRTATYKKSYRFIFRINEKKKQIIIVNLFHNNRDPKELKKYK